MTETPLKYVCEAPAMLTRVLESVLVVACQTRQPLPKAGCCPEEEAAAMYHCQPGVHSFSHMELVSLVEVHTHIPLAAAHLDGVAKVEYQLARKIWKSDCPLTLGVRIPSFSDG